MNNQIPCNYDSENKPTIQWYDEQMVVVNGATYTRRQPTSIVIKEDENTVVVEGVRYKRIEEQKPRTLYEFLIQCETGEYNTTDFEKKIEIENYAVNFLNYLYECCEVIEETDDELVVNIHKTQMVIPNV
jgi:hypothetical protein